MTGTLSGHHQDTYDLIFRHPLTGNLEWKSLIPMFEELGDLVQESNGKHKFALNGHSLTFEVHGKDVEADEIMRIRHFLEGASKPVSEAKSDAKDLIVVLDHHGARIYHTAPDASAPIHVEPLDPSGHDKHVHNPRGDSGGQQGPHRKQFYENLGSKLRGADRILMIGDGHGASNEIDRFVAELAQHHPDLGSRIIGKESMDLHHMSEGELLAKGRAFFKG